MYDQLYLAKLLAALAGALAAAAALTAAVAPAALARALAPAAATAPGKDGIIAPDMMRAPVCLCQKMLLVHCCATLSLSRSSALSPALLPSLACARPL